ncbi:ATP-grasp domain-containing protein [Trinickia violacea]|uniref:ATP-grasp domain-containing protein n=1 Tax=Trinickia violacea TaxID=2571746 RepID=A0A4P8J2Y0_9BURK|nr:ATP-grasp domain-containing protein [Trinickia violacea]QCP54523.1 ATP-grasp domain-containing protein [Trinickia violacea]
MNIVIVNNIPRFPGTSRWDFELVSYQDYIDHEAHRVSYIANTRGRTGITAPAGSYDLYPLETLADESALIPVFEAIVRKVGSIDRLVVFSEALQDVAACLRDRFGIPGNGVESNRHGRDKLVMKQLVAAEGLRVPAYMAVDADKVIEAIRFGEATGFPLVLKPTDGQSSAGVQIIADMAQLRTAVAAIPLGVTRDLEEFIAGTLYHVDGLIDPRGNVTFIVPSEYVNPCLDFTTGAPLGAAMLDPATQLHRDVCSFATRCLQALGLKASPFHLELFRKSDGELVFLEVGARVGGADVPYVIHKTCGINLFGEWLKMIVGEGDPTHAAPTSFGGWLMFPRPDALPQRVVSVTDFAGRLESLYRQLLPEPGEILLHEDGYCSMQSGRFLFCSESAERVRLDMAAILRDFAIVVTHP